MSLQQPDSVPELASEPRFGPRPNWREVALIGTLTLGLAAWDLFLTAGAIFNPVPLNSRPEAASWISDARTAIFSYEPGTLTRQAQDFIQNSLPNR